MLKRNENGLFCPKSRSYFHFAWSKFEIIPQNALWFLYDNVSFGNLAGFIQKEQLIPSFS